VRLILLTVLVRAHPEVVHNIAEDTLEVVMAAHADSRLLADFATDVNLADAFSACWRS